MMSDGQPLTIGRSLENDWVLADPDRVLSKTHCRIDPAPNGFTVTDTSTNGVFINGSAAPLGRGQSMALSDGDRIKLGDYEITASMGAAAPGPLPSAGSNPFAPPPPPPPPLPPMPSQSASASPRPLPDAGGDEDWRALLDPSAAKKEEAMPDQGRPEQDFMRPPDPVADPGWQTAPKPSRPPSPSPSPASASGGAIPDNWWDEDEPASPPAASPPSPGPSAPFGAQPLPDDAGLWDDAPSQATPAPNPSPPPAAPSQGGLSQISGMPMAEKPDAQPDPAPAPAPIPTSPSPPASSPASSGADLGPFLAAAGVDQLPNTDPGDPELAARAGRLFAAAMQGLMGVMASRASLKNEFRLEQTMVQAAENNPLKFSPNAQEAMKLILSNGGQGFKQGEAAIEEAFEDLAAHQVAVLAGMQHALTQILKRFDPKRLEERIGKDRSVMDLIGGRKSRYWDAFNQLYGDIAEEMEEDFHAVFGQAFARAYEEQIRKQRNAKQGS